MKATEKQIEKLILDRLDQALLAARESSPTSFPVYIKELKNEIALLRDEIKEVKESVQPVVNILVASKVSTGVIKTIAIIVVSLTSIWMFWKQVIKHSLF